MSTIIHDRAQERYEALVDGEVVGHLDYSRVGKVVTIEKTETTTDGGALPVARRLTRHVINEARRDGLVLKLECPFTRDFVNHHSEYADVL